MVVRTLHIFNSGFVTDLRLWDEVLKLYVQHFSSAYGSDILFIDDNACPTEHTSSTTILKVKLLSKHRDQQNILISTRWRNYRTNLRKAIAWRHLYPRDRNKLKVALLEKWDMISQTVVTMLLTSWKHAVTCMIKLEEIAFHIKIISLHFSSCFSALSLSSILLPFLLFHATILYHNQIYYFFPPYSCVIKLCINPQKFIKL